MADVSLRAQRYDSSGGKSTCSDKYTVAGENAQARRPEPCGSGRHPRALPSLQKSVPFANKSLPFTSTKPRRNFQLRYLTSPLDSVESTAQFQSKCDDRASTCHSIPQQAGKLRTCGGWQGTFPRAARANARRLWVTPHADGLQLPRAGVHRNGHRENAPRLT